MLVCNSSVRRLAALGHSVRAEPEVGISIADRATVKYTYSNILASTVIVRAAFLYKGFGPKNVAKVQFNSANMSALPRYIITKAVRFSFIMTDENVPQALAKSMLGNSLGMISFLFVVKVIHRPDLRPHLFPLAAWPSLLSMLGFLIVVTYWPGLSLCLPQTMGML